MLVAVGLAAVITQRGLAICGALWQCAADVRPHMAKRLRSFWRELSASGALQARSGRVVTVGITGNAIGNGIGVSIMTDVRVTVD